MTSNKNLLIRLSFFILFSMAILACEDQLQEEFDNVEIMAPDSSTDPLTPTDGPGSSDGNPPDLDIPVDPLDPVDPVDPPATDCGAYGVFPNNPEKDCGWKRGVEDYVFQYNHIVNREDLGPCYNMTYTVISGTYTLVVTHDNHSSFYTFSKKASFSAGKVSSGYFIPDMVRLEFDEYIERITRERNDSDFAMGQYLGYMSASGQEPLTSPNVNCGGSGLPFN